MNDENFKELLAAQLEMNRGTWSVLQSHGVTDRSQLSLDFKFKAPNQQAAESLCAFLKEQTDYDVSVLSQGIPFFKSWSVEGSTKQTAVSLEILDKWVEWMVTAGSERACEFDGWGTSV